MNSELRKACHKKAMLHNRYFRHGRKKHDWEAYRKTRNSVTKLKAKSMNNYFNSKCNKAANKKPATFWNTIKPFISNKCKTGNACTMLNINGTVCNDPYLISEEFNDYFRNIVKSICREPPITQEDTLNDICLKYSMHGSVENIKAQQFPPNAFYFNEVNENSVLKLLNSLDGSKSTGHDNIPVSLIKDAAEELSIPTTYLVNSSIRLSKFPIGLKMSEISPIYKCNDSLERDNYRPVNVLPGLSKIVEKVYYEQMYAFFSDILSTYLAAFRKKYGCHHVLTKFVYDCKAALDQGSNVGVVLMDLSKAFDCIPHGLLLTKLKYYGLSDQACELIKSYITDRKQRVKIGQSVSDWGSTNHGVPQGSILGPLIFNIFINDIFYAMGNTCRLYNYADDNTIMNTGTTLQSLMGKLENSVNIATRWFDMNGMKSNHSKFQAMILNHHPDLSDFSLCINGQTIALKSCVKLLGVLIDYQLTFSNHVDYLCKKTSKQLGAIRRVSRYLDNVCLMKLFHAFVMSNFNYCSVIWHFCPKASTIKMEKIQKAALRVVLNDYVSTYTQLLHMSARTPLYIRRVKSLLFEVFQCIRGVNPQFMNELFVVIDKPYVTRSGCTISQAQVRTIKYGINTFVYQGAKLWNTTPSYAKDLTDPTIFKCFLEEWKGPECNCGYCTICNLKTL